MTVIRNIVNKYVESLHTSVSGSQAGPVDSSFLDDIQSFLLKIDNAEMAIGCSSWVVMELPPGESEVY